MGQVDNRLFEILDKAASDFPYEVRVKSGHRSGDPRFHGRGMAMDVTLHDPQTGKKIPDYQNAAAFRAYEQFAQRARQVQQQIYPDMDKQFRWGGYFSGQRGKYGAADLMHFDVGGSDRLGMAGGSWERGLTPQQRGYFPGAESVGLQSSSQKSPAQKGPAMAYAGNEMSDDDLIAAFTRAPGKSASAAKAPAQGGQNSAPSAPGGMPDDDLIAAFTGGASSGAPKPEDGTQAKPPPATTQTASASPVTANDAVRSIASGVPIVGGLLNKANAAVNATVAPVGNKLFPPEEQLRGATWGERYQDSLARQDAMDARFAQEHPVANTVGNVTGAVVGTLPAMAAAPAAFGVSKTAGLFGNSVMAGLSGAAIGAGDSAVRSGGDVNQTISGATTGGLFGAAAPSVGRAIGAGANKLIDTLSRTSPEARSIGNALTAAGMTPQEAQAALARLGPEATLADVNPALTARAGALAAKGGAPTSILKTAMAERAAGANSRVAQAIDEALGPKPDLTAALDASLEKSRAAASPLYEAAKSSGAKLDVIPVLASIDAKIPSAVGGELAMLEKARGFLVRGKAGDAAIPKDDAQSLLKVRQAIDDMMQRPPPDSSAGRNAMRAIGDVRAELDRVLKSDPNIAKADAIYAGDAKLRDAMMAGTEIFKRNVRVEDFKAALKAMQPGEVDAMRQGARVAIGDALEQAQRGELAGAQQMFGKGAANRAKLENLFPGAGKVFDMLHAEGTMRATERHVAGGSQTAERLAIQQEYAIKGASPIDAGAALIGESFAHGAGAPLAIAKAAAGKIRDEIAQARMNRLTEGSARGLAATGDAQKKFMGELFRAVGTQRASNMLTDGGSRLGNALTRAGGQDYRNRLLESR